MLRPAILLLVTTAAVAADGQPVVAGPSVASAGRVLSCAYPVRRGESARNLLVRFGKSARFEVLTGAEGENYRTLVLWPDDAERRVEVSFEDERMTRFSGLHISGPRSQWRAGEIAIGDTPAQVRAANGAAFTINGFDWDYGGYADLGRGRLAHLPGGCRVTVRFSPSRKAKVPRALSGDGVHIASGDPRLAAAGVRVSDITVELTDAGK